MPADEYARRHRLSADVKFDINSLMMLAATPLEAYDLPESLQDGPLLRLKLPIIERFQDSPEFSQDSPEFLQASKEVLDEIISHEDVDNVLTMTTAYASSGRERQPKLELPLLRSDHDFDCRELLWSIKERTSTHMDRKDLPYEPLDVSSDETLEYPQNSQVYHRELERDATKHDRVRVSKNVLSYIFDVLRDDWSDRHFQDLLAEQIGPPTVRVKYLLLVS